MTYIESKSNSRWMKVEDFRSKEKGSALTFLCCDAFIAWVISLTRIPPDESSADESKRDLPSGIDVVPAAAAMAISSSGDNDGLGRSGFDVLRGTRRWKYNELGRRLADFDEMAVRSAAENEVEVEAEGEERKFV